MFKSSTRVIQKSAQADGDLIGSKIADKVPKVLKTFPQNNLETDEEILREKYISPELRQKIIDDSRLK